MALSRYIPTPSGAQLQNFDVNGVMGPLSADNFTQDDLNFLAQKGMHLNRAYRDIFFDRHRHVSGTALPTSRVTFFTVANGQTTSVDNAAASQYQKQDHDTNIYTPGQIAQGEMFIVQSIQIIIQIASAIDNTVTLGEVLDPTPKAAQTPISPANFIRSILWAGNFGFKLGSVVYEQGPPVFFPAFYGCTGWAGTGTSINNESFAQNGFGRQRFCHPYHVIGDMRNYFAYIDWRDAFVPNQAFYLTVVLDGIHLTSVQ
jgi:hypothetical protein